jgi:TRAP-type C4-dicarboxylate transport system permease small subunit
MNNQLILKYAVIMVLCFITFIIGGTYKIESLNMEVEALNLLADNIIIFSLAIAGTMTFLMVLGEEVFCKQQNYFK